MWDMGHGGWVMWEGSWVHGMWAMAAGQCERWAVMARWCGRWDAWPGNVGGGLWQPGDVEDGTWQLGDIGCDGWANHDVESGGWVTCMSDADVVAVCRIVGSILESSNSSTSPMSNYNTFPPEALWDFAWCALLARGGRVDKEKRFPNFPSISGQLHKQLKIKTFGFMLLLVGFLLEFKFLSASHKIAVYTEWPTLSVRHCMIKQK